VISITTINASTRQVAGGWVERLVIEEPVAQVA
jgi:hypothetical protein